MENQPSFWESFRPSRFPRLSIVHLRSTSPGLGPAALLYPWSTDRLSRVSWSYKIHILNSTYILLKQSAKSYLAPLILVAWTTPHSHYGVTFPPPQSGLPRVPCWAVFHSYWNMEECPSLQSIHCKPHLTTKHKVYCYSPRHRCHIWTWLGTESWYS